MKKPVVLIIFGVLILVSVVIAVMFLRPQAAQQTSGTESSAAQSDENAIFFSVGEEAFVTNVKDSDLLLKASVVLKVSDAKAQEFLDKNIAVIRDMILHALRSCNEEEIRSPDIQQKLSTTICDQLNEYFRVHYFEQAYFTDLVVQ